MKFIVIILLIPMVISSSCPGCGGSGSSGGGGNGSSGDIDRSGLPDAAPEFNLFPFQFPNGVTTDLNSFGIYNLTSDCDIVHYGWDFMPNWDSYPANQVPAVAVADGIISNIVLHSPSSYQGQEHDIYVVRLAVAKEVDVHYTFEPFITFDETYASQWVEVSKGDTVSAGDVIGYLPKVEGNLGENLIHIDWKIGIGTSYNDYVCPTTYFSNQWQQDNEQTLLGKVITSCQALCYE